MSETDPNPDKRPEFCRGQVEAGVQEWCTFDCPAWPEGDLDRLCDGTMSETDPNPNVSTAI